MSVRIYTYKCRLGHIFDVPLDIDARDSLIGTLCPDGCRTPLRRSFSFSFPEMFQAHYSHALGQRIDSERQFATALDKSSAAAEARTGIPCKYVKRDMRDLQAPDSSQGAEQALKSTHDNHVKMGKIEPSRKVFHG